MWDDTCADICAYRYISSGSGTGNAYALAAICAICFPFFYFARIYYPGPPINVVFFFLTSQLVIGYSWQDTHLPSITEAGIPLFMPFIDAVVFFYLFSFVQGMGFQWLG